ncbi:uncharacterized protein LOC142589566 [Dermacentor variabilis]|uniref:uncharacterized protein LOC142589566 n=1 Tax=Dermacentor variabilis TaxID=34621 RepID=UPI003F5BF655
MGVHNTWEELVEAHNINQLEGLKLTKTGRALLQDLGYQVQDDRHLPQRLSRTFPPPPRALHHFSTSRPRCWRVSLPSELTRLQQLLTDEELRDRRPSLLLRRMRQLLGERDVPTHSALLRELFLRRLSEPIRLVVAAAGDGILDRLAELADQAAWFVVPMEVHIAAPLYRMTISTAAASRERTGVQSDRDCEDTRVYSLSSEDSSNERAEAPSPEDERTPPDCVVGTAAASLGREVRIYEWSSWQTTTSKKSRQFFRSGWYPVGNKEGDSAVYAVVMSALVGSAFCGVLAGGYGGYGAGLGGLGGGLALGGADLGGGAGVGVGSSVVLLGGGGHGFTKAVAGPSFLINTVHHVSKVDGGGAIVAHSGLGGVAGGHGYGGVVGGGHGGGVLLSGADLGGTGLGLGGGYGLGGGKLLVLKGGYHK